MMRATLKFLVVIAASGLATAVFAEDAAAPKPADAATAAAAAADAPDPARVAAARDLLEVTGVTKQMDNMVDAMTTGFAKGAGADKSDTGKKLSEQFDASMKKLLTYKDQMIADFAVLYAQKFTAEEMKTVADFYRSGAGAKFITMTPELMKEGAAIGMKYSQKIVDEMSATAPAGDNPPPGANAPAGGDAAPAPAPPSAPPAEAPKAPEQK